MTDNLPPPPVGISAKRHAQGLTVKRAWRNMASWAVLPMALLFDGITVAVFRAMHGLPWNQPIWLLPMAIALCAIGFNLAVVRRLVNVTQLELTPTQLTVSHGPLPWTRAQVLPRASILRLEVRKRDWRYDAARVTDHHLWAVLRGGGEVALLERDENQAQAEWVKQALGL